LPPSRAVTTSVTTIDRAGFDAAIFDLDGVITRTATLHARAWKQMFDDYLRRRGERDQREYAPFDIEADYLRYVDGKPRYDGVRSFLQARGIDLARGDPHDPPTLETICGLGARKNELFNLLIDREGAEAFEHAVDLVKRLSAAGFRTAVVSSSKNCAAILRSVGALDLFDARVDGTHAEARGLRGKPAPDTFLAAAEELGVAPKRAVVFEDALVGVAAGRAGGFGRVVGVDRTGQAAALLEHGADVVLDDLAAIEVVE